MSSLSRLILIFFLGLSQPLWAAEIVYIGSSTVGKFITDASKVYSGASFKIDTRPESSGGRACPAVGNCDVGGVAGDLGDEAAAQGVVATNIGQDGIAAIVPAGSPVTGLTSVQLTGIFTGAITNWSEVGGPDMAIVPMVVKKGSATRSVFQAKVMGGTDYGEVRVITPDAKIVSAVAATPGAIGQISFAFLDGVDIVKPLDIDGQEASVSNPGYPVVRPLNLTTKGAPSGAAGDFITWATSPEGQAVVTRYFIGL